MVTLPVAHRGHGRPGGDELPSVGADGEPVATMGA